MGILIVGASIAGLTSAVALAKLGYKVKIFEQNYLEEPTGLGVGLQDFAVNEL